MLDALIFFALPVIVGVISYIHIKQQEKESRRLAGWFRDTATERDSLKHKVKELQQDLKAVQHERDDLKTELTYLKWDLETAQQLHKIAEHKLKRYSTE